MLLAAVAGIAWAVVGWSFHEAVDAFVVSNLVIGLSFGACGALVAWYRPAHPVGWLYLVGGLCQALSAAAACLAELTIAHGDPLWLTRLLVTVFALAWPLHIGICLPLSLYLLPDGRLPSPRWRPWFVLVRRHVAVVRARERQRPLRRDVSRRLLAPPARRCVVGALVGQ